MSTVEMGISQSAEDQSMILNVLSNTLYTDKVGAVLREYGCNGFDANVEANRGNIPIEVRLPNRLDMSCAIRDFGFGMTEEQVKSTFCLLGRSTKRASNAFTGMLGIGSKAGFAYGDSFLVTSYTQGRKVVYNCYRDQGRLLMSMMHAEDTESPDGIEVKIPVRLEHIQEFMDKAKKIYKHFKVLPKITGQKIDFEIGKPEFIGPNWRYIGDESASIAVMGNVGYTIDTSSMQTGLSVKARALLELGIELDFEIGDLEIAATREGLQYRDITRKAITDRIHQVADEIRKIFTVRIAAAASKWEAHRLYADNFERLGSYTRRSLTTVVDGKIMWKGHAITTGRFDVENPLVNSAPEYLGVSVVEVRQNSYGRRRTRYVAGPDTVYASAKTQLCINDLPSKRNSPNRIKGFFDTNKDKETLVIFTFHDQKVGDKFWKDKQLTGAPTINFSSITPVTSVATGGSGAPSAHRSKHSAKAFVFTGGATRSDIRSGFWELVDVDLEDDEGVFVALDKFNVKHPDWKHVTLQGHPDEHPASFKHQLAEMQKAGLAPAKVYGFKAPLLPKLGDGWTRLETHVREKLDKIAANSAQELADFLYARAHISYVSLKHIALYPAPSVMSLYLFTQDTALTPRTDKAIMSLLHAETAKPWVKKPSPLPKPTIDLVKLMQDVVKTYPLLNHMQTHVRQDHDVTIAREMAAYVTLIGK